jgi:hypothetical protein
LLTGEEQFVIIKLISGEQIMAILEYEHDDTVELIYPMLMRMFPVVSAGKAHEHLTATPYSQFAENAHISVNKRNIIFMKNLHHVLIPHFEKLVAENEQTVLFKKDADNNVRKLEEDWDDVPEDVEFLRRIREEAQSMTTEELEKKIAMLESLYQGQDEIDIEDVKSIVLDGNDTVH